MMNPSNPFPQYPPEQQVIRAKCFHPSGNFVPFESEETEQSIPERFEKIVARYPDRIALKTNGQALSYAELNARANRVAHAILNRRGAESEPVALLLEKNVSLIAAMMGVLKAGKIYVPLEPAYPKTVISSIFEDSQATLILTDDRSLSLAEGLAGDAHRRLNMDRLDSGLSAENLGLAISPDTLSVIRYTSGSTGQPKGVGQDHYGMLHHYLINNILSLHICPEDRISGVSIVQDVFNALLSGAVFCPVDIKKEGLAPLVKGMTEHEITIYYSVPSVFRRFMDSLSGSEKFPNLRLIALRGEAISKADVELYKKHFSESCILVNRMGSRETGTIRMYFVDKQTRIMGDVVPAGYPVPDKQVLLLDDDGKEVGHNQIGEIAVKSRHLRLGYWRRPELTQTKFLPDPEGGEQRLYLTGDLGRMRPDGCLEYLGRKDLQVKIRGFRVEITEVEGALRSMEAVREAAVITWEDKTDHKYLAAYIVRDPEASVGVSEIHSFIGKKLADYMVPSVFIFLDALPLMANGKVNRQALPPPPATRPDLKAPFVAPRSPVEEILTGVWSEVLGLDQVGIHDNFLDLGGQSLLATRIISRVVQAFRVELPLQSLLEAPTVAQMGQVIVQSQAQSLGDVLAEVESLSEEEAQRLLSGKGETQQ